MNDPLETPISPSSLVRNERTKLTANALDRASTACFAVGVLAPIVTSMYDPVTNTGEQTYDLLYFGSLFWLATALILHLIAQGILRRLQ